MQAQERISVLNNMAMVYLPAITTNRERCGRVLAAEPSNTKAKYCRGVAYGDGRRTHHRRYRRLKAVAAQEPDNTQAKKELAKAKRVLKAYRKHLRPRQQARGMSSGLKNMFEAGPGQSGKILASSVSGVERYSRRSSQLITATEKLAQLEAAEKSKKQKSPNGSSKKSPKKSKKTRAKQNSAVDGAVPTAAELRKLHDEMPSDVNTLLSKGRRRGDRYQ